VLLSPCCLLVHKIAFDHITDVVLARGDTSHLKQISSQTEEIIDALTYGTEEEASEVPILKSDKALLSTLLEYVIHKDSIADLIGNDWTNITKEEFDQFRISPSYIVMRRNRKSGVPFLPSVAKSPSVPKALPSSAELFKKGIRRDQILFPTLKDEKFHDSWHRSFENQAHAQKVAEVWDTTYKLTSPVEMEVFKMIQIFVYAILENKVLTSKGKEIVRKYEETRDTQTV
jgi:hypothetical protein